MVFTERSFLFASCNFPGTLLKILRFIYTSFTNHFTVQIAQEIWCLDGDGLSALAFDSFVSLISIRFLHQRLWTFLPKTKNLSQRSSWKLKKVKIHQRQFQLLHYHETSYNKLCLEKGIYYLPRRVRAWEIYHVFVC